MDVSTHRCLTGVSVPRSAPSAAQKDAAGLALFSFCVRSSCRHIPGMTANCRTPRVGCGRCRCQTLVLLGSDIVTGCQLYQLDQLIAPFLSRCRRHSVSRVTQSVDGRRHSSLECRRPRRDSRVSRRPSRSCSSCGNLRRSLARSIRVYKVRLQRA